ncbi:MAG: dephospho-CoA kinase [Clostridiales bacterium]|nr:dephospho-CoA kinase [Clostridiales bacterium]MDY3746676.1 dephospho-CoA kinase [Lachnospiraceae bacterium]
MKVIGITGGAGSGKSEVLKILAQDFGAYVIIADDLARHLSEKGQICYENIVSAFGSGVIGDDGELDRKKLASIVFGDEAKLKLLNEMTHPYVRQAILSDIDKQREKNTASCIVIEAALLIEAGYQNVCDEMWYVYTDPDIRRQRMKETRNYSDEKIDAVMASQLSDEAFRENCDRVIVNNSTLENVKTQLTRIFKL